MKIRLTILLMTTLFPVFGQGGQLVIGKEYSARQDSTSGKVYISIKNYLDYEIEDVTLTYDKQIILKVHSLKSDKRKCYSFLKKELKGDNVFILRYKNLTDTLRGKDEISYDIHKLEIMIDPRPSTADNPKKKRQRQRRDDWYFKTKKVDKCNYRLQKLNAMAGRV
ncbi:MAG: hypothetical protein HOP30_14220 [Cyclobacteriaceae bacterium]|nr:hypothetical protein [Cyclobacteriaceae bacterium]